MKKLLIAMTAAAVGTCAWATDGAGGDEGSTPATPTMLNETFGANWTLQAPWSYWSGAETATPAEGELTAGDALSLNTGSKVLRGNFMSDGSDKDIGTGLYFKATVTFKDPSDTLPTLGAQDKFALVVLDNVESCETYNTEENPVVTPATNLWVIAKYGDGVGVKRAYKLKIPVTGTQPEQDENGGDVLTNLDKAWLDVPHEIVVKAYGNVMADSQTPRAGFMVMVDGYICTVDCSCAIEGEGAGVINPTQAGTPVYAGDVYLGFAKDAINGTLNPRYNKNQLLLSMTDNDAELTSVDFQGQGVIDNVSLATTGADFGPDATVLTFVGYDADKIASITVGEKAAVNGVYTITGSETADEEGKVAIVVTVNEGYVLKGEGWTKNGLTYTYAGYPLPTASDEITLNVFAPAAYVGDTAYETVREAVEAGGEITLLGTPGTIVAIDADELGNYLTVTKNTTLDLNGMILQAAITEDGTTGNTVTINGGNLTVVDNSDSKLGEIRAPNADFAAIDIWAGKLIVEAGTIGLIYNGDADTLELVGGSYTDVGETFYLTTEQMKYGDKQYIATLADGVWTVAEQQAPTTYAVTLSASNVTVDGLTTGDYEAGSTITFTVEATEGYENPVVTVGDETLTANQDGSYTITVDAAKEVVVTASLKTFNVALNLTNATVSGVEAKAYDYGTEISFTAAVAGADYENLSVTIEGAECTQDGDIYTFTVTGAVTITVTADKKAPAGPTVPENQGSVSEPDANGNVTVTPATGVTEITISGTVTGTVSVPSSIEKVSGVEFSKLVITYTDKNGVTSVITDAFKSGENGEIVLDKTAVVNGVPVKPEMAAASDDEMNAPLEVGTSVDVGVKTIPGLKYQLIRSDAPNGTFGDVPGASATGTGAPVKLSDGQKPDGKAFYKIKVMPR